MPSCLQLFLFLLYSSQSPLLAWIVQPLYHNQKRHSTNISGILPSNTVRKERASLKNGRQSRSPTLFSSTLPETTALSPNTFAGMVEQGMIERFGGEEKIGRVLESWRLLEKDYEHNEFVGGPDKSPETSQCHQQCTSYVPGLTVKEFWDADEFEWCAKLKQKYSAIRKEFLAVTADMERLQREGNNIWAGALTEDAASYGEGWKTLVLMNRGFWDPINVNLFPVTSKAIHDSGVPAVEAFFASMKPESEIQPHSDFANFVLTSHLALDIPYSGENKCRLTIGDETRQWINGEVMMFDTSIIHDAVNESDKMRYILMLRVWHPDLTEEERSAIQFTYDCLEYPELVSGNAEERFRTELQVKALHEFPKIKKGSAKVQGFGGGGASSKEGKKKKKGRK